MEQLDPLWANGNKEVRLQDISGITLYKNYRSLTLYSKEILYTPYISDGVFIFANFASRVLFANLSTRENIYLRCPTHEMQKLSSVGKYIDVLIYHRIKQLWTKEWNSWILYELMAIKK